MSEHPDPIPPRGADPRDFMDVHWEPCDVRSPHVHIPHWVSTDQAALTILNCPGRNESGVQRPPFRSGTCTGRPLGPMGETVHHEWCPLHG